MVTKKDIAVAIFNILLNINTVHGYTNKESRWHNIIK